MCPTRGSKASVPCVSNPTYMRCMFADIFTCFAGELPKELGNLVNLNVLDVCSNGFKASCMFQHTCVVCLLTFHLFCRRIAQGARQPRQFDQARAAAQWLQGELYVPAYMRCMFADIFTCFAGELPKELGKLVNLKELRRAAQSIGGRVVCSIIHKSNASNLTDTFTQITGTIPVEFGQLVNLQTLLLGQQVDRCDCMSRPTFAIWPCI